MAALMILNTGISTEYLEKYIEKFKNAGIHVEMLDLRTVDIPDCIKCGKCIKRNYCLQDGIVHQISEHAGEFDAYIIAIEVLYGEMSEKSEHLMTKLMHSSSNLFSHHIILPLFYCRSEDKKMAANKMFSYISEAGGILLTSWLKAEITHEEDMSYAVEELIWVLNGKKDKPLTQYPRNLNFTR